MFPSGTTPSEGGNGGPAPLDTFAVALYDYQGQEGDELTIEAGEHLQVIARHDDGWFLVHNKDGSFGVVPGNYLQVSEAPEPYTSSQLPAENDSMWQVRVVCSSLHMRKLGACLRAGAACFVCRLSLRRRFEPTYGRILGQGTRARRHCAKLPRLCACQTLTKRFLLCPRHQPMPALALIHKEERIEICAWC